MNGPFRFLPPLSYTHGPDRGGATAERREKRGFFRLCFHHLQCSQWRRDSSRLGNRERRRGEKNTNSPFLLAHILFLSSLPVRPVRSSFRLPSVSLSLLLLFSLFLSHTPTKGKEEGSEVCRPSPPAPLFSLSFSIPSYTNCCV